MNKEWLGFVFFILFIQMAAPPESKEIDNKIRTTKFRIRSSSGMTVIVASSIEANSIRPDIYQVILIKIFLHH